VHIDLTETKNYDIELAKTKSDTREHVIVQRVVSLLSYVVNFKLAIPNKPTQIFQDC